MVLISQTKNIMTQEFGLRKGEISFKNRLKKAFEDLNNIDTLSIK